MLALSERGAGVPLRELALVGLTAAIITYFCTGWVRVLATRLGAVAYPQGTRRACAARPPGWVGSPCTSACWLRCCLPRSCRR